MGKKGTKELLAIALNPSTANESKLDSTSRNIETIAYMNNCDGWWLINLYPMRSSKPKFLPKKANEKLAKENYLFIKNMTCNLSFHFSKILCCWGNKVDLHLYLKKYGIEIIKLLEKLQIPIKYLGTTKNGNPTHPSPMATNIIFGGIKNITLLDLKADEKYSST